MGFLGQFKGSKGTVTLDRLMREPYVQKYFNECKFIWKNYVPKNGQSSVLQGELLRELEKLRWEAQDNGNINWDDDYTYFCDFIKKTLCRQTIFSETEKRKIVLALDYINDCGNYAKKWNSGQIAGQEVDMDKIAYTKDNLYDIVADAIGFFQMKNPEPIPYQKSSSVKR